MNERKIREFFFKLRQMKEEEMTRAREKNLSPLQQRLLSLLNGDASNVLDLTEKSYLSGDYTLDTKFEFGNFIEDTDPESFIRKVVISYYFSLHEEGVKFYFTFKSFDVLNNIWLT